MDQQLDARDSLGADDHDRDFLPIRRQPVGCGQPCREEFDELQFRDHCQGLSKALVNWLNAAQRTRLADTLAIDEPVSLRHDGLRCRPHRACTTRRMAAHPVVLCLQDTTEQAPVGYRVTRASPSWPGSWRQRAWSTSAIASPTCSS
jgi:hypothetical protein